jgi:hypothetical protein
MKVELKILITDLAIIDKVIYLSKIPDSITPASPFLRP